MPVTDIAEGCLRSDQNYASLLAKAIGATLEDRTCSAAETDDVTGKQRPEIPPQASALKKDTGLVTVGLGGNDQQVFSKLIFQCPLLGSSDPTGSPCREAQQRGGRDLLREALRHTSERLQKVLELVRQRSPEAQVLVVGYPHIVAADHVCSKLPLAKGDFAYGEQMNVALNTALRDAARRAGATYVDVYAATTGHDICAQDPWINGSTDDQQRAARYHPFAKEQQVVAGLLEKLVTS